MKVFISWSGERSQALAQILRDRLPLVLHFVEPWLSQSDLEAGERWGVEVAKELDGCAFGITCITSENVTAPWLLFEAGALAKSMQEGRVIPLLLDIDFSDISGPLAQFQAKKVDKSGINDVIRAINNNNGDQAVPDLRLGQLFEALWPDFEKTSAEIPKTPTAAKRARPQSEVLEELVQSVRSLEIRYRDESEGDLSPSRRKRGRFRSMMMEEALHRNTRGPSDPMRILMVSSILREDFPWMYELGLELYRALKAKRTREVRVAAERFLEALHSLRRSPYSEDGGIDGRMLHLIMRTVEELSFPTLVPQDAGAPADTVAAKPAAPESA